MADEAAGLIGNILLPPPAGVGLEMVFADLIRFHGAQLVNSKTYLNGNMIQKI